MFVGIRKLIIAALAAVFAPISNADPAELSEPETVTVQQFDIGYELEHGTSQVESVHLWYTTDRGRSWRKYGVDFDVASKIPFNAVQEGLYGFVVIAHNKQGASSPDPGPRTEPQFWAFVDYTPPVVELGPPSVTPTDGYSEVHISWTAADAFLSEQPIELAYRWLADGGWTDIGGKMANDRSYDWRIAPDVAGDLEIRIRVSDRGGHVVETVSDPVSISRLSNSHVNPPAGAVQPKVPSLSAVPQSTGLTHENRKARAIRLYREGVVNSLSGEYKLAASRLRGALELDPGLTGALVELANVLYAQESYTEALGAYQLAVEQNPGLRSGIHGMARVYIKEKRFAEAVKQLSRMVQANPNDVEAWLNLGDVAVYQGDASLAREHYQKAATLDPARVDIVAKSQLRLNDLSRLADGFSRNQR